MPSEQQGMRGQDLGQNAARELQGQWNRLRGQVKEKWGQLTDDDLSITGGNVDQLVGKIQQKTGVARETIEKFLNDLTSHGGSAVAQAAQAVGDFAHQAGDQYRESYTNVAGMDHERYGTAEDLVNVGALERLMSSIAGLSLLVREGRRGSRWSSARVIMGAGLFLRGITGVSLIYEYLNINPSKKIGAVRQEPSSVPEQEQVYPETYSHAVDPVGAPTSIIAFTTAIMGLIARELSGQARAAVGEISEGVGGWIIADKGRRSGNREPDSTDPVSRHRGGGDFGPIFPPGRGEPPGNPPEAPPIGTPEPDGPSQNEAILRHPSIEPTGPVLRGEPLTLVVDLLLEPEDERDLAEPVRIVGLPPDWSMVEIDFRLESPDLEFKGTDEGVVIVHRDRRSTPTNMRCRVRDDLALDRTEIEITTRFYLQSRLCGSARRLIPLNGDQDDPARLMHPVLPQDGPLAPPPTNGTGPARSNGSTTRPDSSGEQPATGHGTIESSGVGIAGLPWSLGVEVEMVGNQLRWVMKVPPALNRALRAQGLPDSLRDITDNPMAGYSSHEYIRERIAPLASLKDGTHYGEFLALGERIYELTPLMFRKTYWALRKHLGNHFPIQFLCSDLTIPWELMRPFPPPDMQIDEPPDILAMSHPVGRWLLSYETRVEPNPPTGPIVAVASPAPSCVNEKGEAYPRAPSVAEVILDLREMGEDLIELPASRVTILDLFLGKLDTVPTGGPLPRPIGMLYLGGHGEYDSKNPDNSRLILDDGPLKVSDIRRQEVWSTLGGRSGLGVEGPIVVINACGLGEAGPVLSLIGGWAEALMRSNFSACVAPLWPVYEVAAHTAMSKFFEQARGGALSLAEAVRDIRKEFGKHSPTFLALTYYGDVMAIVPEDSSPRKQVGLTGITTE